MKVEDMTLAGVFDADNGKNSKESENAKKRKEANAKAKALKKLNKKMAFDNKSKSRQEKIAEIRALKEKFRVEQEVLIKHLGGKK